MRWRWWPWPRRHANGTAVLRAIAEAKQRIAEDKLRDAERETPRYERLAPELAKLPAEDLVDRVARMLRVGHS